MGTLLAADIDGQTPATSESDFLSAKKRSKERDL